VGRKSSRIEEYYKENDSSILVKRAILLEFHGMFFTYWLVLFSAACVANVIGLMISSAFDSVITIYIMVPLILIPQLMFNGVAIEFDKLNPKISSSARVPILGELMTSRWAYEAIMVRQFKDNDYEKHFYDWEKKIADSQYKTSYYLKELSTNLAFSQEALRDESKRDSIADHLELLEYELQKELIPLDRDSLINWEMLDPYKFDSLTLESVSKVISQLNNMYKNRRNKAFDEKELWMKENIVDKKLEKEYFNLKSSYRNEKVSSIVKNEGLSITSILEVNNRLIRKATPIYATPDEPKNPLNFRTFFYAPEKYFAGVYYDTYWFNIAIMWMMTIFAIIALYLDLLKKFLKLFVRIGDYKFRKKIKKAENPVGK
jgi:hypothetical protein